MYKYFVILIRAKEKSIEKKRSKTLIIEDEKYRKKPNW